MIIRRLVTALRKQDWGIAAIDFVIVVAGIFVGLRVDDWAKDRAAAEVERGMLALIVSDIRREADALDSFIDGFSSSAESLKKVADLIQSHPNVNPEELSSAATKSFSGWIWVPYDGAYRNLQQSGDFSILGNEEIAARLTAHYETWGASFDFISARVFEAQGDYREALYTTMIQYPEQGEDGSVSYSAPSIDDIGALRDDGAFWASLRHYLYVVEHSIRAATLRRERAREEITLIEDYLALAE